MSNATGAASDHSGLAPSSKVTGGRSSSIPLVILALIVALAALASAWLAWQTTRRSAESGAAENAEIKHLSDHVDRLAGDLEAARTDAKQARETLDALERKQSAAADAIAGLLEASRQTNLDWALAEIEYLLVIATHRLQLLHDVPIALAAMEAAAKRLDNLHDPGLTDLHMQLAADTDALKAVRDVDISGLTAYLTDLAERVNSLPLSERTRGARRVEESGGASSESGWRNVLLSIWNEFKGLVVVTRTKSGAGATLLPDEQYFLFQNLRLQLETARLAVVRRDTHTLRASLAAASDWLRTYFDTDSEDVANILESFGRMQQVDLDPKLPDISSSLETLRAFVHDHAADSQAPEPESGSVEPPP